MMMRVRVVDRREVDDIVVHGHRLAGTVVERRSWVPQTLDQAREDLLLMMVGVEKKRKLRKTMIVLPAQG